MSAADRHIYTYTRTSTNPHTRQQPDINAQSCQLPLNASYAPPPSTQKTESFAWTCHEWHFPYATCASMFVEAGIVTKYCNKTTSYSTSTSACDLSVCHGTPDLLHPVTLAPALHVRVTAHVATAPDPPPSTPLDELDNPGNPDP